MNELARPVIGTIFLVYLFYRAFSLWAWLIFIICCGNKVLFAESSKLGKLTSEILNDLQFIVRSYMYFHNCNPSLKMNG